MGIGSAHTSFSSHPSPNTQKSKPILTQAKHMMWLGGTWLLPVTMPRAARNLKVCSRKRTNVLLTRRPDLADPPPAATACKVQGRVCQTTGVHRPASKPELPRSRKAAPGPQVPLHTSAHVCAGQAVHALRSPQAAAQSPQGPSAPAVFLVSKGGKIWGTPWRGGTRLTRGQARIPNRVAVWVWVCLERREVVILL